jgi:hypothetical protein
LESRQSKRKRAIQKDIRFRKGKSMKNYIVWIDDRCGNYPIYLQAENEEEVYKMATEEHHHDTVMEIEEITEGEYEHKEW